MISDTPSVGFAAQIHEDIALRRVTASISGGPLIQTTPRHPINSDDPTLYEIEGVLNGVRLDEQNTITVVATDTSGEVGRRTVSFWAGRTPRLSHPSARFAVRLYAFHVNHETWDDILSRDGVGDEVFYIPLSGTVDSAGQWTNNQWGPGFSSVMGQHPPNAVQAGSGSSAGGLRSTDHFLLPSSFPNLFIGALTQGENAAVIFPNLWEYDGPSGLRGSFVDSLLAQRSNISRGVAAIIRGPAITYPNVFFGRRLGLRSTLTLGSGFAGAGEVNDRPIGMRAEGDHFGFIPSVLVLTYDAADAISRTNYGNGVGIIALRYRDDDDLQGDYTLYLQVLRL